MKAEDFVKIKFPKASAYPMVDNYRRRLSYVIIRGAGGFDIFPNEGATTASKAWTNAKKYILSSEQNTGNI